MKEFEDELRRAGYREALISTFSFFNWELLRFLDKEPEKITNEDIKRYLMYLIEYYGAKESTINTALFAFSTYYEDFLKRESTGFSRETILNMIELTKKVKPKVNLINTITQNKHG